MTKNLFVVALLALTLSYWPGPESARGQDPSASSKDKSSSVNAESLADASRLNERMIELFKSAKYEEALLAGKRVLELRQSALGPQHLLVASTLKDIGEIYLVKKKFDEAEKLLQQALAVFEKEPGQNQTVSYLLETLGAIQFRKHHYDRAASLVEKALAIKEQGDGKADLALAETLHGLANIYQLQRRYKEAEPLYVRALLIREKTRGRSDPGTVAAMKDYACLNLRNSIPLIKPDSKADDADKIDPADKERQELRSRALCWLGELTANCADDLPKASFTPEGLLNGKALSLPKPKYPIEARNDRVNTRVFVAVLIDESGKVVGAKAVCSGKGAFINASLESAREARFSPTILNNKPSQTTGIITYSFVVQ